MVTPHEEGCYGEDISLFWGQNTKFKTVAKLGANGHTKQIRTWVNFAQINPVETKRRLLYLKTQFVPRCKYF
jgi:hypothetical protein